MPAPGASSRNARRFPLPEEGLEGNQRFATRNNARYLRVQIRQGDKQFPVTGAVVSLRLNRRKTLFPSSGSRSGSRLLTPLLKGKTTWTLDLGNTNVP